MGTIQYVQNRLLKECGINSNYLIVGDGYKAYREEFNGSFGFEVRVRCSDKERDGNAAWPTLIALTIDKSGGDNFELSVNDKAIDSDTFDIKIAIVGEREHYAVIRILNQIRDSLINGVSDEFTRKR